MKAEVVARSIEEITFEITKEIEEQAAQAAEAARLRQLAEWEAEQAAFKALRERMRAEGVSTKGLIFEMPDHIYGHRIPAFWYTHERGWEFLGHDEKSWVVVPRAADDPSSFDRFDSLQEALRFCVAMVGEYVRFPSSDEFREAGKQSNYSLAVSLGCPNWMVTEWRRMQAKQKEEGTGVK